MRFFITLLSGLLLTLFSFAHDTDNPEFETYIQATCHNKNETHGHQTICQCILYRISEDIGEDQLKEKVQRWKFYNITPANPDDRDFLQSLNPIYKHAINACYPLS